MHDSVYEMAGDPRVAKAVRLLLTELGDGPDGPLKEMAEGILAGNLDPREAAGSAAYGDELGTAFGSFWTRYQQLGPDERAELVEATERELDDLLDRPPPAGT